MTNIAQIFWRKWSTWQELPWSVQALLLPSWCLLGIARLAVLLLPFRFIARWLGPEAGVTPFTPLLTDKQTILARNIGQSVALAARYTPWESLCQPQAMAARFWLGLYGIPCLVSYGVKKSESNGLDAHAWVSAGPVAVTGGQRGWQEFTLVRSFIGPAKTAR
jgi:hypothetical protein